MLAGDIHEYGLRALVAQLIRQELGRAGSAPSNGIEHVIYRKLAVTNRTEAVGAALRRGLISLDAIAPPSRAA